MTYKTIWIIVLYRAQPPPLTVSLSLSRQPSVYSDGSRFQEAGSGPVYRLEIPKCRVEDTGAYSIVAKNDYGETRAVISLQVYTKGILSIF